jgi:hypothetical protein
VIEKLREPRRMRYCLFLALLPRGTEFLPGLKAGASSGRFGDSPAVVTQT